MLRKCRRRAHARIAAVRRHQSQGQQLSDEEEYGGTVSMELEKSRMMARLMKWSLRLGWMCPMLVISLNCANLNVDRISSQYLMSVPEIIGLSMLLRFLISYFCD